MGWTVKANGKIIWSPALAVGRLFLAEVQAIEANERAQSGIQSLEADTITVDLVTLRQFIHLVLRRMGNTNNGPLLALMAGCVRVCIALLYMATGESIPIPARLQPLIGKAASVIEPVPFEDQIQT